MNKVLSFLFSLFFGVAVNASSPDFSNDVLERKDRASVYVQNKENDGELRAYSANKEIVIENLSPTDIGSELLLYDVVGRPVKKFTVDSYPLMRLPIELDNGLYTLHLTGDRNVKFKIVVKED